MDEVSLSKSGLVLLGQANGVTSSNAGHLAFLRQKLWDRKPRYNLREHFHQASCYSTHRQEDFITKI